MDDVIRILAVNLAAAAMLMTVGWIISLFTRNVTIADTFWGMGFVAMAWLTFALSDGAAARRWLIVLLVTTWGLRLSLYLSLRNRGKGEDPRYASWREKSGGVFWLQSYFKVFLLQALFMWVIALGLQFGQLSATPDQLTIFDVAGASFWLVGFIFEATGDAQLAVFKADPKHKGRVMDRGLWRFTRHPNYFGEALLWWGIFLIAFATPNSWWTVISPIVITAVLLKMTGIPLTEQLLVQRRPGYKEYIRRTNAFFPWFPKEEQR